MFRRRGRQPPHSVISFLTTLSCFTVLKWTWSSGNDDDSNCRHATPKCPCGRKGFAKTRNSGDGKRHRSTTSPVQNTAWQANGTPHSSRNRMPLTSGKVLERSAQRCTPNPNNDEMLPPTASTNRMTPKEAYAKIK